MLPVGWVVVYSLLSSVDPSLLCLKTHFSTLLPCTLFWRAEAVVLVKTWSTHEGCFSVLWPCPQVWLALPAWSSEGGLSQLSCPPQALGSHQFILSGGRDSLPCPQCSSGPWLHSAFYVSVQGAPKWKSWWVGADSVCGYCPVTSKLSCLFILALKISKNCSDFLYPCPSPLTALWSIKVVLDLFSPRKSLPLSRYQLFTFLCILRSD